MFYKRNRKQSGRKPVARKGKVQVSKNVKRAVKQVLNKQVETKTINCPQAPGGSQNSNNTTYGALSGIQYMVQDVFRQPQGVSDGTTLGSANRIGDKIKGVGFLCDYYFRIVNFYSIGPTAFPIPYVKLRITLFTQAFGSPLLSTGLVYDTNFNATNTSTLQPINWNEGYVKNVLYDKVHIIRNNLSLQGNLTNLTISPLGQVFHFKKYFKYDHNIKYTDNNTLSPNSTDKPIYIAVCAEVDDSVSGAVPSGQVIMAYTGYTRAWFKDA